MSLKKARFMSLGMLAVILLAFAVMPVSQVFAATNPFANIPVTGTTGGGGTFSGVLTITNFVVQNGVLMAQGVLNGTAVDPVAGTVQVVNQAVTAPVTGSGSCTVLDLHVGAIHLNLLGLVIDTNPIDLSITAQRGAGNLLGNLLCAVANLLNNGGPLTVVSGLLNQILGSL